jgi:hypothetical protein
MKIRELLLVVLFASILGSCASNKNEREVRADTDQIQRPTPIGMGSANVKLEVIDKESKHVNVRVIEVMGYGSNVTRIANDAILQLSFTAQQSEMISSLSAGDQFDANIAKEVSGMDMEENISTWNLIKILD